MAALLGLDLAAATELAAEAAQGEVCACANDNAPGQVVVSGDKTAVERAVALAKSKGGKRAIMLPVSAPFHCALMQPAADAMARELERTAMAPPTIPLVANVTARAVSDPATIRALLVRQTVSTVRWRESALWMKEQGVVTLVELGAGKVLSGLAKRIDPELQGINAGSPEEIDAILKTLGG
jgi:[acyl-carrier-protein] S-malonyltransferase